MIGVPDMKRQRYMSPRLNQIYQGKTLLFTHGFAIHFGLIKPHPGKRQYSCSQEARPGAFPVKEGKVYPAFAVLKDPQIPKRLPRVGRRSGGCPSWYS